MFEFAPLRSEQQESGLSILQDTIDNICVVAGIRTKAVGLYNSLRATESDMRRALNQYLTDIRSASNRIELHREKFHTMRGDLSPSISQNLDVLIINGCEEIRRNTEQIGLIDNGASADSKIAFHQIATGFQRKALERLQDVEQLVLTVLFN